MCTRQIIDGFAAIRIRGSLDVLVKIGRIQIDAKLSNTAIGTDPVDSNIESGSLNCTNVLQLILDHTY